MAKKPSNELNIELSREGVKKLTLIASIVKTLVENAKWMVIAICGYLSIDSLAGKLTQADISIVGLLNTEGAGIPLWIIIGLVAIALITGFFGVVYGRYEAKLRKDTVEILTAQIISLQHRLDPGRSSSGLTTRGETHERDRP